MSTSPSSSRLLLTYYGDDFTGSTDVLESLAKAGIEAVLFIEPPTPETLQRFSNAQAIGVAGMSRSFSPHEMENQLRPALAALADLGAPLCHYKVCSTFDSSPEVGSIGKAIDLGREVFATPLVPVVVGAPGLGRYCAFSNLFARSGLESEIYRLDRHPSMSRHPTTPMTESDLRLVLAEQTNCRLAAIDVAQLERGSEHVATELKRLVEQNSEVVIFDTVTDDHLLTVGEHLWRLAQDSARGSRATYVVGSSGVEYALGAYWQKAALAKPPTSLPTAEPVEQVLCVSGSCSPVTARQIEYALDQGFAEVALEPETLLRADLETASAQGYVEEAVELLSRGRSVILHTSRGPEDPRIKKFEDLAKAGEREISPAVALGGAMGLLLRRIVEAASLRRVVVAGGDTAGHVARRLGIEALQYAAPLEPGAPLCRITSEIPQCEAVEIAFKGGQVGHVDFFLRARDG